MQQRLGRLRLAGWLCSDDAGTHVYDPVSLLHVSGLKPLPTATSARTLQIDDVIKPAEYA